MKTRVELQQAVKSAYLAAPNLRPARFEDYEGISRLWAAQSWVIEPETDWRSMWLNHPLWAQVGKHWPIGWVLEDRVGDLVGTLTNIPTRYVFRGQDLIAGNSRGWAVTPAYRGYALWLIEEYYSQSADLCISTTAGPMAVAMIEQLAIRIPLGDWESGSHWQLGSGYLKRAQFKLRELHIPFALPLAYPAAAALRVKDSFRGKPLPRPPASYSIEETDRFDSRFDGFWIELVHQNPEKLLADRASETLAWHYDRMMRMGRLLVFTASREGQLRAYCVLIRSRGGHTVYLIDYQTLEPSLDLLGGLLRVVLQRCEREGVHSLENLGRGVPKMRSFDRCAPYRRKLPSWGFFYRAADRRLENELRSPDFWDPSAYDGDASLT